MTTIRETIARAVERYMRLPEEADEIWDEVLRALEAEGWRVVPNEPDQRMIGAYITSVRRMPRADRRLRDLTHEEWFKQHAEKCAFRWRAMLAAPKMTE